MVNTSKRNSCPLSSDKIKQNIGDLFKTRWASSDTMLPVEFWNGKKKR